MVGTIDSLLANIMSLFVQVFFSYIGFDAVATMAEEVIKPERDLPVGIVGSVILVWGPSQSYNASA